MDLHSLLAKDTGLQSLYLDMCRDYLPIMFSSLFWTLNPQCEAGSRNVPFILRPKQVLIVEELDKAIKKQKYDFGLIKSRKQGATEIICKTFAAHLIFYEYSNFIVGSRKEDLVDNRGDYYTIFAKIDHVFNHLPSWMNISNEMIDRKDMSLKFKPTSSTINGETTNESFKAGSRSTALFLDEFGRVDKRIAESIEGSIHDVCNCIIYCSTHWYGLSHTFNKCLLKPTTHCETLFWYENEIPHDEVKGLYEVVAPGKIRLVDENYYNEQFPGLLGYCEETT